MTKTLAIAGAAILSLASAAFAIDRPGQARNAAPAYSWTGFYLGANGGYGWGKTDNAAKTLDTLNGVTGVDDFTATGSMSGGVGGIQAGYNWQTGAVVFGVEADIDFGNISGNANLSPLTNVGAPIAGSSYQSSEQVKWFGTVRGRLGYTPVDRWLVYATGGFAFGRVDYSTLTYFPTVQYSGSESATKSGWTLGLGTEWAFADNWSAKFEYLYFDLGGKSIIATSPATTQYTVQSDFSTRGNVVRIGLNRKF